MRRSWLGVGGVLVLTVAVGCASGRSAQRSAQDDPNATGDPVAREMDRVMLEADGNRPGQIVSVTDEQVVLDPFEPYAPEQRLGLTDEVPVFQGGAKVSSRALSPGVDVRVFYKESGNGLNGGEAVAIEILDADEADAIRQAQDTVPGATPRDDTMPGVPGDEMLDPSSEPASPDPGLDDRSDEPTVGEPAPEDEPFQGEPESTRPYEDESTERWPLELP